MAETIGIQRRVHGIIGEPKPELERRGKLSEVLSFITKFAFESTVVQSLRITTGRKQEQSKDENRPRDLKLTTEEMQAKIEKIREDIERTKQEHNKIFKCMDISGERFLGKIEKLQRDMSNVTVQCKTSFVDGSSGLAKKSDGGDSKGLDLLGKNEKRVFIRSRL